MSRLLGFIWVWCFLHSAGMSRTCGLILSTITTKEVPKLGISFLGNISRNLINMLLKRQEGRTYWIASLSCSIPSKSSVTVFQFIRQTRMRASMFALSLRHIMQVFLMVSMLDKLSILHLQLVLTTFKNQWNIWLNSSRKSQQC